MTKRFKPSSTDAAVAWWNKQSENKLQVYWDSTTSEMLATDEADMRKLNVKNLSKIARIYSADNIRNLLNGIWQATPSNMGMVISAYGTNYIRADIQTIAPNMPNGRKVQRALEKPVKPSTQFAIFGRAQGAEGASFLDSMKPMEDPDGAWQKSVQDIRKKDGWILLDKPAVGKAPATAVKGKITVVDMQAGKPKQSRKIEAFVDGNIAYADTATAFKDAPQLPMPVEPMPLDSGPDGAGTDTGTGASPAAPSPSVKR